jgi:L-asparaginase
MPPLAPPRAAVLLLALLGAPTLLAQEAKPGVHVIATGGTISNMGPDPRRTGAELVAGIPQLTEIAQVTVEQFSNVASGAITLEMWRDLARRVRTVLRGPGAPAGVVITHGTDTMEETVFFLDLTVGGCAPVILTGAMRQANWAGADGPANLLNSVRVAVDSSARGRGAMLLLNDEIFAARDVTKSNTTRLNAFTAPGAGPIGVADPDGIFFHRRAPQGCPEARFDIERIDSLPRVDILQAYIGADSTLVDALVAAGAKGIVLAGVGRGGSTPSQSRALRRAVDKGVTVVISNRTGSGRVGSRGDDDELATLAPGRGAMIDAADFNPQKARVLLMLGLASGLPPSQIARLFDLTP